MNKVTNLIQLAYRAGKVAKGDSLLVSIQKSQAKLVLVSSLCGQNRMKKIQDKCRFYGVDWIVEGTAEELSAVLGQPKRIACAVLDEGLARSIQDAVMK